MLRLLSIFKLLSKIDLVKLSSMQILLRTWQEHWCVNNFPQNRSFNFPEQSSVHSALSRKPTNLEIRNLIQDLFIRVRTNFCTDKNLQHVSTLHLHGTGGTGQIFEQLSVQV